MTRPAEIISEMDNVIELARAHRLEGPESLEDWMRQKMGEADALQTAYAQPIVRLILQKNIDDMYATQQALVLCDPSHTALIGALQARVMWHQMLPTWLRETIDAARDRQDAEEQIADPAERYIDE